MDFPFLREFFASHNRVMQFHTAADVSMALSFSVLTLGCLYFLWNGKGLKFRKGFWIVSFLFLMAVIHGVHLFAPWYPVYTFESFLKLTAGLVSLLAVLSVLRLIPEALQFQHPQAVENALADLKNDAVEAEERQKAILEDVLRYQETARAFENELTEFEKEIDLLPAMIQAFGDAGDFDEGLEIAVRTICKKMEWEYAEAWIVAENGKVLEYSPVWYGDSCYEPFHRISQDLKFPPGMGLGGRVWASKKAEVVPDLVSAANGTFFRVNSCQELGLNAAFGVPVLLGGKVLAVLIFLMSEFKSQDKRRTALISAAAGQLGCLLGQKAAEKSLREGEEQQEKRVRERTKELIKANQALEERIVEHKRSEEVMRRSQENFSTMLNSLDGIVWELDLKSSRFSFVSDQAEQMLGYPVSSWFAEPTFWQDHIHGGDRAQAVDFRTRVAQEKKGDRCEYRMITNDGRTIWLRDLVTVVVEDGEVVKLRGVMVNITESKQVAEALDQEKSFVSAVFETASALVMILDTNGRIVRFNKTCEQTSGYSAEEVKGKFFWDLFSVPEEVTKNKNVFSRLLAGQYPINEESYWVAKDGSRSAIAWSNTVLLNRYGAVIHIISTGVDITKRKEVEKKLKEAVGDLARSNQDLDKSSQELKDANQRLRELDEIKSHFISAASHELRTPLTSIKGYVESVLEDEVGPLNEKQKEFLGYVKASTDRLHRLLNELLDLSKIEAGQVKMQKDLTNIKDLLKEETMIFNSQAGQKNISLNLETEMHLREIYCDGDKIKEVMDNLLNNAIKYTPKGGRVKIEAKNFQTGVQIDVQDNGIGISKEDIIRIFEPFQHIQKSGTDAEDEESTGLGLALVKRIVEAHGGDVLVKSQPGKGSVFTVVLPLDSNLQEVKHLPWAVSQ